MQRQQALGENHLYYSRDWGSDGLHDRAGGIRGIYPCQGSQKPYDRPWNRCHTLGAGHGTILCNEFHEWTQSEGSLLLQPF